jgi:hypothetical protein
MRRNWMTRVRFLAIAAGVALLAAGCTAPGKKTAPAFHSPPPATVGAVTLGPTSVAPGIWHAQTQIPELDGAPQSLNVLWVAGSGIEPQNDPHIVFVDPVGLSHTSEIATDAGATAAVNGTFYDTKNYVSVCFLKIDGHVVAEQAAEAGWLNQAGLAVTADGDFRLIRRPEDGWRGDATPENVMVTGPLLLWEGERVAVNTGSGMARRHPRTVVGTQPDGTIVFVTVDGRHAEEAAGMNFDELQALMLALGCEHAINLDGGGSTTMWVADRGVVNFPSDNRQFDHAGERRVDNSVLIFAPGPAEK